MRSVGGEHAPPDSEDTRTPSAEGWGANSFASIQWAPRIGAMSFKFIPNCCTFRELVTLPFFRSVPRGRVGWNENPERKPLIDIQSGIILFRFFFLANPRSPHASETSRCSSPERAIARGILAIRGLELHREGRVRESRIRKSVTTNDAVRAMQRRRVSHRGRRTCVVVSSIIDVCAN
jgi:hypothetical protein